MKSEQLIEDKEMTNGEVVLEKLLEEKKHNLNNDIIGHDQNYAKHYNDWEKSS